LQDAHIRSHPELARPTESTAEVGEMSTVQLDKLIKEAKQAARIEIINPSLREQLNSIVEEIGQLWKPSANAPHRTIFINSEVTSELLK